MRAPGPHRRAATRQHQAPNPFVQRRAPEPRQMPPAALRRPRWVWGARLRSSAPTAGHAPAEADLSPPQGEGCPVAEDGGHRAAGRGAAGRGAVCLLPQGFPTALPALQLQVGTGGAGGARAGHGHGPGAAQLSLPAPFAGCVKARCAQRVPWTWGSKGAAACFATSAGTHRLREWAPHTVPGTPSALAASSGTYREPDTWV